MITIVLFIGGIALAGAVCYLALRPLVVGFWRRWQREREQTRVMRLQDQRRQMLRDEATTSVLRQLAQREEATRNAGRKAA